MDFMGTELQIEIVLSGAIWGISYPNERFYFIFKVLLPYFIKLLSF